MRARQRFGVMVLGLATALLLGTAGARADTLVVSPSTQTNTAGDSNNGFPFNLANFGLTAMRYQQVYASSQFISVGGNMEIVGISFRSALVGGAFSTTLPNVQIDLSTTSAAPGALNPNYNSNVGADDKIVFSGPLTLSSSFTNGPGNTKAFDINITFTTPFDYDPALGNLLLQVRNFGGGGTGTDAMQFDADINNHDDLTSRLFADDNNPNSTNGTADLSSLITRFDFVPQPAPPTVPEPSSLALLSLGGLGLAGWRRWRKRATA